NNEEDETALCDERSDVYLRRFRFGASGQPYSFLKYSFMLHVDRIGEDEFSATKGSYKGVGLWNAYTTIKALTKSELLNVHLGYFWAAVSRDFMTAPWTVGSFDKSYSTYYLRHFITGAGNGITSGVALGGLKNFDRMGLNYRVGIYNPQSYLSAAYSSRLYTGRVMWSLGDPEQKKYKYMLSGNHWSKRNGVTLGVGASSQKDGKLSETLFFDQSWTYGGDLLVNYGGWSLTAEYYKMGRNAKAYDAFEGTAINLRAGYNIKIKSTFIEPNISYDSYQASGDESLYKFVGDDNTFDVGVNWYLNKDKLKVALHYVMQEGSAACNSGDYMGLALQFKL
ncbi:MAG: hypothetical protein PF444_01145, partial [Bacteroidales bacterium]|nr:hypothetical protein [Bacteroidales bacterium]